MRALARDVRLLPRIIWELGGPFGVLVFYRDGTLDESVAEARRKLEGRR